MLKRSEQIMLRVNPEIKERFAKLCAEKGMTMSTMAAYMIGDYVQQNWKQPRDDESKSDK